MPPASDLRKLLTQFLQFGAVGVAGLVVDTATVYGLRHAVGLYAAGMLAYLTGATTTWALNRIWTFRGTSQSAAHRQWAAFLLANIPGFCLNRGTYVTLIALVPLCAEQPVLATSAGALAGMIINFTASRQLVFR